MTWRRHNLSHVIERLPIGVAVTLPIGTVEYANPHLCRMLGHGAAQMLGKTLARFAADGGAAYSIEILRRLPAGESWQGESRYRTAANDVRHVLESVFPLRDEEGRITHFMHFLQDVGAMKVAERLSSLAFYDGLTGLPNRNLFRERLSRAIASAQRNCRGFAMLYIDIDRFKDVNDVLGHDAGDELLRQIAGRLQKCLRKTDTVARLGGDEFVVILDESAEARSAEHIVDKLLAECSGDYELQGSRRPVTLSIGVGLYPRDGPSADALLRSADQAMYRVKSSGRNGYRLRDPGLRRYGAA